MEIGTCLQAGCQMKKIHYHCPVETCNFIFELNFCGGGCGGMCCPAFVMHVHCRLCDDTEVHAHCNRCQRVLRDRNDDINIKCEYCDLGGNCDKCGILIPNINTQTRHRFCNQCNICIDPYEHIHCPTCNLITGSIGQHYHCRWCSKLTPHIHTRKHHGDNIQQCGVERCTKTYNHTHCTLCDWINNPGPFQFHRHCSQCDRTDSHRH